MNILIELPTWLGDSVMASAAIENIAKTYKNAKIVFFGSVVSCELFKTHPNCDKIVIDNSKKRFFRLLNLANIARNLGKFDIAISFRSSFASKIFIKFIQADKKVVFKKNNEDLHQVQKYENFIRRELNINAKFDKLKLHFTPLNLTHPILGINPGASYGSAKRWYPQYFAEVACKLSDTYEIVIFGGKNEIEICYKIEEIIKENGKKCLNLCAKTDIAKLCEYISSLDLFITNDSGPMHIAAAYQVPTIALFGPTKFTQTSPYKNKNAQILHLDLTCMPCMKRRCPIKTHDCMKNLTPKMVLKAIRKIS